MWSVKFEVSKAIGAVCGVRSGVSREGHGRDKVSLIYKSFMFGKLPPLACQGRCYSQMFLHTNTFTHRHVYPHKLLHTHRDSFLFHTHTRTFTHRGLYTQTFPFCTQTHTHSLKKNYGIIDVECINRTKINK